MSAANNDFVLIGDRVVIGDYLGPAAISVSVGVITDVVTDISSEALRTQFANAHIVDAGNQVVMPGLVDNHVHINEPGNTAWEGFETATRAAAAGGVTTIVDMPLNSIPVTTTVDALKIKVDSTRDKLWVDVGLLGGIVPGNEKELGPMIDLGVVGFKCFMIHSGLDEFPHVTTEQIQLAAKTLKEHEAKTGRAVVYMFHAEVDTCHSNKPHDHEEPTKYSTFLNSRPREFENEAIKTVIDVSKEFGQHCHIVHLSSSDAVHMIRRAKSAGVKITAETTFHYLYFASETIPDSSPVFKCCPPIREKENREKLWSALKEGVITQVISDHSPCVPELKKLDSGDLMSAWGGIASLQLGLPAVWTRASERGCSINQLARWMALQTAELVKLDQRKGSIAIGKDADFVVWDPEEEWIVAPTDLQFKNKVSPYVNEKLRGVVKQTWLRGQLIYKEGQYTTETPVGEWTKPFRTVAPGTN
jgi:allantoinase